MIDNFVKAMALLDNMEQQLPIPVQPNSALYKIMLEKGAISALNQEMVIEDVHYAGDEGGIVCVLAIAGHQNETHPFVVSLTHLYIQPGHPLEAEITAYQTHRVRNLERNSSVGRKKPRRKLRRKRK